MPFGLKNAGATYQRLMEKAFEVQVGRNIEVYVDDLVVKSHTEAEMVRDIEETFRTLRKVNMKLNPKKMLVWVSRRSILRVISRLDVAGRLQKWSIMLREHNITYRPRTSVKGQILADFLIEMPGNASQAVPAAATQEEPWTLFTDGSSCVDRSGPFPKGPGKVKFLIVAMDYFTKYIEAKAVAMITGGQVKKFVWDNIVCRFDVVNNDEELRLNLDLLEERRELAAISEAKSKSKMMKYYNARVRGVAFKPGDFVYRNNDVSHAVPGGKLGPKWEGPYEVTEALGNGAYKLRS
nr:retrovirus-related Pol polyprotein from transposon 17.6 [Tanacetum cinerariifolium]